MWVRKEFDEHTGRGSWVPRLGRVDETSRLARPAETGTSHNTTRRPARGGARGTAPPLLPPPRAPSREEAEVYDLHVEWALSGRRAQAFRKSQEDLDYSIRVESLM
jgi:hypothetical protein